VTASWRDNLSRHALMRSLERREYGCFSLSTRLNRSFRSGSPCCRPIRSVWVTDSIDGGGWSAASSNSEDKSVTLSSFWLPGNDLSITDDMSVVLADVALVCSANLWPEQSVNEWLLSHRQQVHQYRYRCLPDQQYPQARWTLGRRERSRCTGTWTMWLWPEALK